MLVVGLGPGDPDLVTAGTLGLIAATPARYLRTTRHPSAHLVDGATSFDDVYETASTLEEVYRGITEILLRAAEREGEVLYAVPGSPLVAERSVELLRAATTGVEVTIVPALSFIDLAWDRLGVDPLAAGVRLVDGQRFATEAAGSAGPLLVGQTDHRSVLSEIKLSVDDDPGPVVVLAHLGLPDESVREVAWEDLDRTVEPDHLTCVWVPRLGSPVAGETARLVALTADLRARCDWDRVQTHSSLRGHLLEESYEVLEAIDELPSEDGWEHLEEELGDLLLQVVFHSQLAREEGRFGFAEVARGIHDKLVGRHPHLFGLEGGAAADSSERSWDDRKRAEKGRTSVLDGVPASLPALARAEKLQRRVANGLGLDWQDAGVARRVLDAELAELGSAMGAGGPAPGVVGAGGPAPGATGAGGPAPGVVAEIGDVLLSVVGLARKLGVDAELALRSSTDRFARRVVELEQIAGRAGLERSALGDLDAGSLGRLWEEAKRRAG